MAEARAAGGRKSPKEWSIRDSVSGQFKATDIAKRILDNIAPCPLTGCWFWLGAVHRGSSGRAKNAYGVTSVSGKYARAHRASYEAFVGAIPPGMVVDHLCRQSTCVNPGHLELVTNKENVLRGDGLSAANARVKKCRLGHELVVGKRGSGTRRFCATCRKESKRRYVERKRLAP